MNINPFIELVSSIITLYNWVLIIWIILNWLIAFNIINRYQPVVSQVMMVLGKLTEPILNRIRRFLPDLGSVDLSPIVLFLALNFFRSLLFTYFYK